MQFHIELAEDRAPTRAATQLLGGLTLFREAVAIRTELHVDELLARLDASGAGGVEGLRRQVVRAGDAFLEGEVPALTGDDLRLVDALMRTSPLSEDLELESLTRGTLTGVLRDLIRSLAERFAAAVQASTALLPSADHPDLSGFRILLPAVPLPQRVSAGLFAYGARQLRTAYAQLKATSVTVRTDDRPGGFGRGINPVVFGGPGSAPIRPAPTANA